MPFDIVLRNPGAGSFDIALASGSALTGVSTATARLSGSVTASRGHAAATVSATNRETRASAGIKGGAHASTALSRTATSNAALQSRVLTSANAVRTLTSAAGFMARTAIGAATSRRAAQSAAGLLARVGVGAPSSPRSNTSAVHVTARTAIGASVYQAARGVSATMPVRTATSVSSSNTRQGPGAAARSVTVTTARSAPSRSASITAAHGMLASTGSLARSFANAFALELTVVVGGTAVGHRGSAQAVPLHHVVANTTSVNRAPRGVTAVSRTADQVVGAPTASRVGQNATVNRALVVTTANANRAGRSAVGNSQRIVTSANAHRGIGDTFVQRSYPAIFDTFTETVDTVLASHTSDSGGTWAKHPNITGDLTVDGAGDTVYQVGTTVPTYIHSYSTLPPEIDIVATLLIKSTTGYVGITFRSNNVTGSIGDTYYLVRFTGIALELWRTSSGTATLLQSYATSFANGTTITVKIECRNAAKKVFLNGVERLSDPDNTITAYNRVGIRGTGTAMSASGGIHLTELAVYDLLGATVSLDDISNHRIFQRRSAALSLETSGSLFLLETGDRVLLET